MTTLPEAAVTAAASAIARHDGVEPGQDPDYDTNLARIVLHVAMPHLRDHIAASLVEVANERVLKAVIERERAHELRRDASAADGQEGDRLDRVADTVSSHAWALRNQADGLWEAAALVRGPESPEGAR